MILILRILPIISAAVVGIAFWFATAFPAAALWGFALALVVVAATAARLTEGRRREFAFWHFLLTPTLFLLSAALAFLFLEDGRISTALAVLTTLLVLAFLEHIFLYFHQQARYRVLSLERISLLLHVCTHLLLVSVLYGLLLLVHTPLWLLVPAYFLLAVFLCGSMLWVTKVSRDRAFPYAGSMAILLTELFVAISFLPSGHVTNAALLSVFLYAFFGLCRAQFVGSLTRPIMLRYLALCVALLLILILSSSWV